MTLYCSTALQGDIAQMLGAPHYSYHFAARRFTDMLIAQGQPPVHLHMPEYYASAAVLPAPSTGSDVHLIFRSTEQIRLLKCAINICCFAWEFPVLKTQTLPGEHPFANQHAMLSLCDEVWTPSTFAADVLHAHGIPAAYRIPAPVPLPSGGRRTRAEALAGLHDLDAVTPDINFVWPEPHQNTQAGPTTLGRWMATHTHGRKTPTVFLSVLNPEDFRKNIDAMLRGFHHLRRLHPGAVLIVKMLTSQQRFTLGQVAGGVLRNKLASGTVLRDDGIAIINAYLSDAEMSLLYSLADFYLCTSLAEGQNLPLLEAMGHGTVAVSTRNTAMNDYLTDLDAFVIPARETPNDTVHLAGTMALRPFTVSMCTARDVMRTAVAAIAAKPAARAARAKAAIAMITAQFSEPAVWALVRDRLARHAHTIAA